MPQIRRPICGLNAEPSHRCVPRIRTGCRKNIHRTLAENGEIDSNGFAIGFKARSFTFNILSKLAVYKHLPRDIGGAINFRNVEIVTFPSRVLSLIKYQQNRCKNTPWTVDYSLRFYRHYILLLYLQLNITFRFLNHAIQLTEIARLT